MKKFFLLVFLMIISLPNYGQEAKVIIDKMHFKFDEIFEVTFELNSRYDSIAMPEFKGLEVIGAPTKNSSYSNKNGEQTIREARTYKVRPERSGKIKIKSPVYYIDGKSIKGDPVKIIVDSSRLTQEELEEKRVEKFIEEDLKPNGALRITFHEGIGYIEVFSEMSWKFHRRLTSEELLQIKMIN